MVHSNYGLGLPSSLGAEGFFSAQEAHQGLSMSKKTSIADLPNVRGKYRENVDLGNLTWFQVGGPADVIFKPLDTQDLCHFLQNKSDEINVFPMGVGSNLIVRDGGIRGVVVRLTKGFQHIFRDGNFIDVGAGILDRNLAELAGREGWGGLSFLCGIPGTIGGALRMNAGCYGSEISDILEYALVVDHQGRLLKLSAQELNYSYRHCGLSENNIFVGARLRIQAQEPKLIQSEIADYLSRREETQPVRERTGGSTFANPPHHSAWKLIDAAGCRGYRQGGAVMSEMHCNFMINEGNATAHDLESLGEHIRQAVHQSSKISLNWEIRRVGEPLDKKEAREAA